MPKILAIDDNNDNLISLKAIIYDAFPGYIVHTALNGLKGIEFALAENPDVILLDVIMPGMDGFEVCRLLKLDERVSDIPVVFLTALKGDKENRIKALEVGAEGFLSKPIDETELIVQVRAMVKIKAANEQKRDEMERLEKLVEERTSELVQSQAQLKGIFENLQDAYFQADLFGLFTIVSPSSVKMYGYQSPDELIGQPADKLYFDSNDRTTLLSALTSAGSIKDYVCQGRKKDGSAFWASMNVQLLKGSDGQVLGTEGVVRDISGRKKAEDELKESEERFRHISSSSSDISYSCVIDTNGNSTINWLYGATEKITGFTNDEILSMKCWGKLVIDEDFPIFERCILNASPGITETCQLRLERKDGDVVWIQATAECVKGPEGETNNILYGGLIDITERKKAEELLRESEYFFKESQRAAFIGSYKFDINADVWTSSEILEQIFGIDNNYNSTLWGWFEIVHPDDREMMQQYFLNEVVGQHKSFNKEYRIVRKSDREVRWVHGLGKLDFDARDNVVSMIGTIQDITERKRAEELLRETDEFNNSLLKTIPFGMDIVDEQGNILFQSENMETTFSKRAIGSKCWELYRDDKSQCNDCPLKKGIVIGETATYESSGVLGGRIFSIIHTGMMFQGKKAMLEIFQDITDRKRTEEELRESQHLFSELFNASPDAIVLIDPHHPTISWPIVDCNAAACLMNGYSRQEMIGQSIDLLNVTDGTPDDRISYFTVLKREGIVHSENYHHHKDGHNFPIETSTSIVSIGGLEMVLGIDRDITERKQAEVALKKSEDRYRQFISQISEGVYRFECDQPMDISLPVEEQVDFIYDHMFIAECNDAFMKMYRIADRSEIIGKRHLDFHGGRSHPLNREIMRNFVKSGYHIENAITEEAGFEGQYLVISNNWLGIMENNQLIRMWGTQFDITEKIRAEKVQHMLYSISNATLSTVDLSELIETISNELGKLLDSTNFFIAFYDEKTNMLSTIYEKDEKDTIDTWSAEKSITGYVIRNEKSLLIHEAEVLDLIKTGEIENVGTLSKVWLGVPLKLNNKVIGAIVVQSYDNPEAYSEKDKLMLEFVSHQISASIERKKIEQELKLMGKAFDQSPVTIVITDKNGNIEYTNPKFSETTGYVSEEVRGKNPRVLQSGSQSKAYYQELWRTILAGNDWFGEFQNKRKNGELYWESAVISPITDESGDITFFMAIKEEITEKKKMIADLIQARNKAEESDRLKSSFLANMSHEIRTPLNSIIGFSELMTDRDLDADQQSEFAKIIQNSGNSLLSIISDIMDFSKIEAGQIKINKFPFVTQKLISEIQKEYSIVAQAKGIELRIDSLNPKEDIWMTSDENRLRQILINLVGNAIKFTKEGYVELGIKALGDCVQFRVTDTGIGIPEEYHNKIFERFRQVESANSRKYGGNGLGLAISKSLVEILGGEIWIESVQRKGSTFYFTIPIDNTTI